MHPKTIKPLQDLAKSRSIQLRRIADSISRTIPAYSKEEVPPTKLSIQNDVKYLNPFLCKINQNILRPSYTRKCVTPLSCYNIWVGYEDDFDPNYNRDKYKELLCFRRSDMR